MDNNHSLPNRKPKKLLSFLSWVEDVGEHELSTLELGAHERLKRAACRYSARNDCPPSLPDNDAHLARAAGLRSNSWRGRRGRILALWHLQDDGRWHYQALDERYQYLNKGASRSEQGRNKVVTSSEQGEKYERPKPLN
jgi:uncharacterized protein YdaU (DUF1376 family)